MSRAFVCAREAKAARYGAPRRSIAREKWINQQGGLLTALAGVF